MTSERCDALWREMMQSGKVWWMDGMAWKYSGHHYRDKIESDTRLDAFAFPVWTDPATIGCLVAMAREATGDAEASCMFYGGRWYCHWHANETIAETEPEALLLAIQAATQ